MLPRSIGWLLVAVLLSAGPGLSQAKARRPARVQQVRVVILPVQVKGLSADLGRELGVVLIRELRDLGVFRVLPGKTTAARLNRLKRRKVFTPGCIDNPRCVRRVGKVLRAKVLYHLEVSGAEKGIRLNMRTFDVRSGKEVRQASEIASSGPGDADRAARWVTRMVSSPMITTLARGKGRLQVDCDQPDAELILNGKSFGKRTGKSFRVSSGVFEVEVRKDGFAPFRDVVVIKPGQEKTVPAELEPEEESPPAMAAATGAQETGPGNKPGKQKELPPWAVFEKKKKPKALATSGTGGGETTAGGGAGEGAMPWQRTGTSKKPYLPEDEPVEKDESVRRGERSFYQTWWFWTLIGAGVAAAGGTAAYFLLSEDEGSAGVGNAMVVWP